MPTIDPVEVLLGSREIDGDLSVTGALEISGNVGFFGTTAAAQQGPLTGQDSGTVDATYGTAEANVIDNNRTRIAEIETALQNLGLLA